MNGAVTAFSILASDRGDATPLRGGVRDDSLEAFSILASDRGDATPNPIYLVFKVLKGLKGVSRGLQGPETPKFYPEIPILSNRTVSPSKIVFCTETPSIFDIRSVLHSKPRAGLIPWLCCSEPLTPQPLNTSVPRHPTL